MVLAVSIPSKRELVLCAAQSVREHKEFIKRIAVESPELIQTDNEERFFLEADLSSFKVEPVILEFTSEEDLNEFVSRHNIETTSFPNAQSGQRRMLEMEDFTDDSDARTLAEIHGIVTNDPWDRRTDEEKAQAEAQRKKMKDKKSSGDLTEDSWGGGAGLSMTSKDSATIPVDALPQGNYWAVVVTGALGNSAEEMFKSVKHECTPLYMGEIAENEANIYVFADWADADKVRDELADFVEHVGSVAVVHINERGRAASDGGGSSISIRDVDIKINDDGSIEIGQVVAEKDLYAANIYHITLLEDDGTTASKDIDLYETLLKRAGLADDGMLFTGVPYERHVNGGIVIHLGGAATYRMQEAIKTCGREYTMVERILEKEGYGEDNEFKIASDELVQVYFRVDVADRSSEDVLVMFEAGDCKLPYRYRDLAVGGSWYAYVRRSDAEQGISYLVSQGVDAKLAEVDHLGQRIVEEGAGASVIDTEAAKIEPPAPWNDRSGEFYALDEKERAKALGKLCPFLLYSLRDHGYLHRIIVHITPKSYFFEHGKLWEGDLPLDDLLPDNFEKFGSKAGVYQVKSLDLNTTDFLLGNKAKMRESLLLRSHLNEIGDTAF